MEWGKKQMEVGGRYLRYWACRNLIAVKVTFDSFGGDTEHIWGEAAMLSMAIRACDWLGLNKRRYRAFAGIVWKARVRIVAKNFAGSKCKRYWLQ